MVALSRALETVLRLKGISSGGEVSMATEPKRPDPDEDIDEPTEEELDRQRRSTPDWKHPDDGKSLSDLDEERPLKP
jgi:hypothetical protein